MLLRLLCAEHNCALRTGATLQRLSGLLSASTHEPLHALLHSALLPAAAAALRLAVLVHPGGGPAAAAPAPSSSQELGRGQEAVRLRGRAWALLGLARLHLAAPPAGADPSRQARAEGCAPGRALCRGAAARAPGARSRVFWMA